MNYLDAESLMIFFVAIATQKQRHIRPCTHLNKPAVLLQTSYIQAGSITLRVSYLNKIKLFT